jgi:glycosyltransferase involved in cell wall biosynthesis
MAEADALLLPTMHDSGPWTVAEAVSLGCPVVALDRGGPALLTGGATLVAPGPGVARRVAEALVALDGRPAASPRWSAARLPALVDDWYSLARRSA